MSMVFVVMGSVGEYSDHREWGVAAFLDEQRAKDFVIAVSARARELYVKYGEEPGTFWWGEDRSKYEQNELDPSMQMSYTGTNYCILSVPLR